MELRDELEVPGHVVIHIIKTQAAWIAQAREVMANAENYGATTPNEMRACDRESLRQALKALGQKVEF